MNAKAPKRQTQVLEFMASFQAEHGMPPTIREMAAALGVSSPNSVMCHLRALERKGAIERFPGGQTSRVWRVLTDGALARLTAAWAEATDDERQKFLAIVLAENCQKK